MHMDEFRHLFGERERMQWNAQKRGYAFVDLDRIKVGPNVTALISAELAREFKVFPVKVERNQAWVIMLDPDDREARDALYRATGCEIVPVMGLPAAIHWAIDCYYPQAEET